MTAHSGLNVGTGATQSRVGMLSALVLSALHSSLARVTEAVRQTRDETVGTVVYSSALAAITNERKNIGLALPPDLAQLVQDAAAYRDAIELLPTSAGAALLALAVAQRAVEEAVLNHATIANEVLALDDATGRIRRKCGAAIQKAHIENSESPVKPIAETPLDKMAGDHPEYVAHRELIVTRKQEETDALAHVTIVSRRYETAKLHARLIGGGFMPVDMVPEGVR